MGQVFSVRPAILSNIGVDVRAFLGSSTPMNSKLMTLKDFAERIGVSYSTARRMVAENKVRVVRPRRRPMIPASEVAKYASPVAIVGDDL